MLPQKSALPELLVPKQMKIESEVRKRPKMSSTMNTGNVLPSLPSGSTVQSVARSARYTQIQGG